MPPVRVGTQAALETRVVARARRLALRAREASALDGLDHDAELLGLRDALRLASAHRTVLREPPLPTRDPEPRRSMLRQFFSAR